MTRAMTEPGQSIELLPCPFCGEGGEMSYYTREKSPDPAGYMVECCSCSAHGEPFEVQGEMPDRVEYTKRKASDAWNTRAHHRGEGS